MSSKTNYFKKIGVSEDYLVALIEGMNLNGPISQDYIGEIAQRIANDVAKDIYETADRDDWGSDDVRLAVGRVLCKRLHISV